MNVEDEDEWMMDQWWIDDGLLVYMNDAWWMKGGVDERWMNIESMMDERWMKDGSLDVLWDVPIDWMVVRAYNCTYCSYSLLWARSRISWVRRLTVCSLVCAGYYQFMDCSINCFYGTFEYISHISRSIKYFHGLYSVHQVWAPSRISWIRWFTRSILRCNVPIKD
jgi:hypothetical protein